MFENDESDFQDVAENTTGSSDKSDKRTVMLCPVPPTVTDPKEAPVPITVVTSLKGFVNSTDAVIATDDVRLLACVIEYSDLLDLEFVLLIGVPNAVYTAEFDLVTWPLDRLSYDELLSDVVASGRVASLVAGDAAKRADPAMMDAGVKPRVAKVPTSDKLEPKTRSFNAFDLAGSGSTAPSRDGETR